ncbi:MAG: hypothetical protein IOC59_02480 [Methylobacterium sp.]|nr:hypothetical protein [Methylobacterium sp.]MCA3603838.1 hypothetical protein [Methylobacterium sp.]MCA3614067.1 hypothetical protein [Methylobacterium sp.]
MTMLVRGLLLVGACLLLAGCNTPRTPEERLARLESNPLFSTTGQPEPLLQSAMSGVTSVSYSGQHGTQVSYYAPDGAIYLWYPGNAVVLKGEWKALKPAKICYKYGERTYNPHAFQPGGQWACQPVQLLSFGRAAEERKGDVFGLARRTAPPFVSRKGEEQYREIVAKLPPATAADRPSRMLNAANELKARGIEESDKKIWAQVSQPPATPKQAPSGTSQDSNTED